MKYLLRLVSAAFLFSLLSNPVFAADREWYVDGVNGSDSNSGDSVSVDNTASDGVCDGTTAFSSVTGGFTGHASRFINVVTKALFSIATVTDDNNIVLSATCVTGTSLTWNIGGEWKTIQYAADTEVPDASADGKATRINIQNTGTYTLSASIDIDTNNSSLERQIIFQGYGSTIGDGTRAIIDANNAATNAFNLTMDGHTFIDFDLRNATGDTINMTSAADFNTFIRLIMTSAGDDEAAVPFGSAEHFWVSNEYDSPSGQCADDGDGTGKYLFNYCHDSGAHGFEAVKVAIGNIIDTTGSTAQMQAKDHAIIIGNTFYDANGSGADHIVTASSLERILIMNNIFEDAIDKHIEIVSGSSVIIIANNNMRTNGGTATSGVFYNDLGGGQTSNPGFTDAAGGDFRIDTTLKALALPTADYSGAPSGARTHTDIGALQRAEAGGGGGASSHTFS